MGDSECERKHGAGVQALGAYIDGLPAGTKITLDDLVRVSGLELKSVTNAMSRFNNATVWVDPEDGSMYRMALDLNPAPPGEVWSSMQPHETNPNRPETGRRIWRRRASE